MRITSKNYVENVLRTESPITPELVDRLMQIEMVRLMHGAMGVVTESGELMDAIKKHVYYGKPLDKVNVFEEISDVMWYCGILLDTLGYSMDDCLQVNIDKLKARYPGKFTEEAAINRDLTNERKVLEGDIDNG